MAVKNYSHTRPNAVTIDYLEPAIYWADARADIIARGDLNGNNVVVLLRDEGAYHPYGLVNTYTGLTGD